MPIELSEEQREAAAARIREIDAAQGAESGGDETLHEGTAGEDLLAWFEELEALEPVESLKAVYAGREFTISCPKMGRFRHAGRHLSGVAAKAKALGFEGGPLQLPFYLLHSWDSMEFLNSCQAEVCAILDVFLGEEPGWVDDNLLPHEVAELCGNYIRVMRLDLLKRNFTGGLLGAIKGQMQASGLEIRRAA